VPEQFRLDLELERVALRMLNDAIELCRNVSDAGSRELLEHILKSEESHVNWLEAQLALIEQVGEGNYLAQQIKS
jgi:bacterioferritin